MLQKLFIFLYLSIALALSSCSSTVDQLKDTVPVKSAFHSNLASYYLEFSEQEAEGLDWLDSEYFAEKGLIVAKGGNVDPEPVENWDIPNAAKPALKQARQYLVEVLTADVRYAFPELAAKTLFSFDCWVEQQEENASVEDVELCREDFYENLDMLYTRLVQSDTKLISQMNLPIIQEPLNASDSKGDAKMEMKEGSEEMKTSDAKPKTPAKPIELYYEALFEFDKHKINKKASAVIKKMFDDLKEHKDKKYQIRLNGHADRVGTEQYNMALSQRRADTVKDILVKVGLPAKRIELYAFGETDPKVITPDGVRHPQNRRVEIEIRVTP